MNNSNWEGGFATLSPRDSELHIVNWAREGYAEGHKIAAMDSLVSRYQKKLETFRIKELKDVLGNIGIAKQGKKQVLLERIIAVLSASDQQGYKSNGFGKKHSIGREEVAKVIDNIFSKRNGSVTPELSSKNQNGQISHAHFQADEFQEPAVPEAKTRCPCGSSVDVDTMIQCDDKKCGVWQHLACVIIPEKPVENFQPEIPSQYYCEVCRINRGDPFCVTMAQPLNPTKLITSIMTADGPSQLQNVEKAFVLTKADKDLLQKPGYDLQAWCLLLNDKVPFRMHWPQYADLRVNGMAVWVTNRQGPQLLGINGRDDGPGITAWTSEGTNKISLSAYDARPFCLGVRIIHRRTVQQVLSLVTSQSEGELFEESLGRVKRCVGGGASLGNSDDSDSDLEVVAESVSMNLRCPLSGSRIKVAGRFKPCIHMGCFDINTFVELNQRARKWQCPICMKNYSLEDIVIDPYFNCITSHIKNYPEDVTEVEVKPDGCWRPKHDGENKLHEDWRLPDGSINMKSQDIKNQNVILKQVKQDPWKKVKQEDVLSEGHMTLKIGIKRNQDGSWKVSGADIQPSEANNMSKEIGKQKFKAMLHSSSSATASNRVDEDASVNQEASWNLEFSENNDADFDSTSLGNACPPCKSGRLVHSQAHKESEVVVLSDSEEENGDELNIGSSATSAFVGSDNLGPGGSLMLNCQEVLPEGAQVDSSHIPFIPASSSRPRNSFCKNSLHDNVNPSLELFVGNGGGDSTLPHWPVHAQDATFTLFGTDADVPDATGNSWHDSAVHPSPFNTYSMDQQQHQEQQDNRLFGSRISEYRQPLDCSPGYLNTAASDDQNDNSRDIGTANVPLQFFLPPQPARESAQGDRREPREPSITPDDVVETNWISLGLGGGNTLAETHTQERVEEMHDRPQSEHERGRLDSLANTASVLLNMSNNKAQKASTNNCGSARLFSYHQRPRSARPRLYLPVESDSD